MSLADVSQHQSSFLQFLAKLSDRYLNNVGAIRHGSQGKLILSLKPNDNVQMRTNLLQ